jgi:hypothetical protein
VLDYAVSIEGFHCFPWPVQADPRIVPWLARDCFHSYLHPVTIFFCNPILFAICTSTFSKLCINVFSGM